LGDNFGGGLVKLEPQRSHCNSLVTMSGLKRKAEEDFEDDDDDDDEIWEEVTGMRRCQGLCMVLDPLQTYGALLS
jgi:hypothetical protein